MGERKQINIKNRNYYFYKDIINLDEFDKSKIKFDRKNFNDIDIYSYRVKDMKGQFKKGKSYNVWYLIIFGDTDVLRKFANIWKSNRAKIEENTGGIVQYGKDYMRIKFESNDNLATDNIVSIHFVRIIIRSVFLQNGKFYPQLFLDDSLYKL